MAIIKCPECGRQISDKAPFCPNCGVAIAGKIVKCPQCGEVYFNDQEMCPNCHHLTHASGQQAPAAKPVQTAQPASSLPPTPPTPPSTPKTPAPPHSNGGNNSNTQPTQGKKGHGTLIIALVLALLACGICFYFYSNAKDSKEEEAYEFAMKSDDPTVLQTYLDTNPDAPEAHRDSIQARLDGLKQQDVDWTNAVVSGSRTALEDYLNKHPESEHKAEAMHKIDSIDWTDAKNENTEESLKSYLTEHANGEHVDEANDALKVLKAKTVQPEEKSMVSAVFRHFFQAINSKNESGLQATVAPLMTSFLGKQDATKADVVVFMDKIYKDDVANMNWHINNDYKINKKEVGDEEYQYSVSFSAVQKVEKTDGTTTNARFNIKGTIGPDGLISSMSMIKILE